MKCTIAMMNTKNVAKLWNDQHDDRTGLTLSYPNFI